MKRLVTGLWLAVLLMMCPFHMARAQEKLTKGTLTLKDMMNRIEAEKQVSFVYDAAINTNMLYKGTPPDSLLLEDALEQLFRGTNITWKIKKNYVMLYKEKKQFTLNGYVFQKNGESLINATIFDRITGLGTLTNAYGYYSFTLPAGEHVVSVSYVGFQDTVLTINLTSNLTRDIYLEDLPTLGEVVVTGDLNSQVNTPQTGKVTLSKQELNTEFSLMSSPDLVKSLQRLPGVNSGTELISGLYVHGGTNDGNLFLIDGNPLYQVNHLGGLFSAFNTDIIKTVDFYKSGFPARYGGRLSSVTDVRTNDGDMQEYHGSFSIGLLDGRIQLEGPIIKNKTSFNFAMRRSWADLITSVGCAIINSKSQDEHINYRYAFHDINAKLTHRFSERSRMFLSVYSGDDLMKIVDNMTEKNLPLPTADTNMWENWFKLRWGNITTSLNWNYVFSPKWFSNFTLVYSRNKSKYENYDDNRYFKDGESTGLTHTEDGSRSTIDDTGYRLEFDYRPLTSHHIRFGSDYLHHAFRPQSSYSQNFTGSSDATPDTLASHASHFFAGNEFTLYAEDEITLLPQWKVNVGVHYTLFRIENKNYHAVDPRIATQIAVGSQASVKFSYTEMNQFVHQLSNTYLNLPIDYWVPSTRQVRPMRSRQWAAGYYARLPYRIQFSVEGYYKTMSRMLEYSGGNSLTPSVENWENLVEVGKGRAYGAEFSLSYAGKNTTVDAAYTLSWSERKFNAYNRGNWYPDHFDNRHKLNLTVRHRFSRKIEMYAAWTFHTGDRVTVATQQVEEPAIPGVNDKPNTQWVYETANNVVLPAYHRLDLGVNFRHFTRHGHERIWNVSLYNAYCRMNPLYAKIEEKPTGGYIGKATGIFPIIPSFSYTLKF